MQFQMIYIEIKYTCCWGTLTRHSWMHYTVCWILKYGD